MLKQPEEIKANALRDLEAVSNIKELEAWRVRYLGKRSELTGILRSLAKLPLEERKRVGALANQIKADLEENLRQKGQLLRERQLVTTKEEPIDITLPGRPFPVGRLHPITQTIEEICDIFVSMGFQVVEGPEVEWNYYNFEALNIPRHHPARDSMATLWVDAEREDEEREVLLRTHCTAISARVIETMTPPIRAIEPGKVYRYEATDATHLSAFYMIDGVAVGS